MDVVSSARISARVAGKASRLKLKVKQVVQVLLLAAIVEHGANFKLIDLEQEKVDHHQ